jgi:hypothetical protein
MDAKKVFLAIGIIFFFCICVAAVLAFLGLVWVKNSGVVDVKSQSSTKPSIEIERSELDAYLQNLDYACGEEMTPSAGELDYIACSKQSHGESFSLSIAYSKETHKPVSLVLFFQPSGNGEQKENIASVFSEVIRIPYKGSNPDEAAAWIKKCMEMEEGEINISKRISDVRFSFYKLYEGRYMLDIRSDY